MLRTASRWACVWLCTVTLLMAGWVAPARADGESGSTTSWLYAWTWDWVTWAEEFGFDIAAWAFDLLPCTGQICDNTVSFGGTERFYWKTGYRPPTANAITGASVVYDHVSLGAPGSSATVRFDCGTSNSDPSEDRFVFHDLWVHFMEPSNLFGHYLELLTGYTCGPDTGNTYYRFNQAQQHRWWTDNQGQTYWEFLFWPDREITDFNNNWRYTLQRSDYRWLAYSSGATDSIYPWGSASGSAPQGVAIEWGTESNFNGGKIHQAHVRIQDTRHQYGEGNGYFPHDHNGWLAVQEPPWGGHIGVYTNSQNQKFNNGVHTCTYSSSCGG